MGASAPDQTYVIDVDALPTALLDSTTEWFTPNRLREISKTKRSGAVACDMATVRISLDQSSEAFDIEESDAPPDFLDLLDDLVTLKSVRSE